MNSERFNTWIANIKENRRLLIPLSLIVIGIILLIMIWQYFGGAGHRNIIKSNGRIEATEINIAPRMSARVKEILVHEGDYVNAGQVIAYMDTDVLNAQLKEAQGIELQADSLVTISQSRLSQSKSEKSVAEAQFSQREVEMEAAERKWNRSSKLLSEGAISKQSADDDWVAYKNAMTSKDTSQAHMDAANAAIDTAQEEVIGAESKVKSAKGNVERIEAEIRDSTLRAPRDGRVQYRVAQPGEVVEAGRPVVSLVDLSDVYMTFFLSTASAGRIAIGEEVRLILDAAPKTVIPAYISYVSDVAQFTPKSVETTSEREKLMFRVKARISPELLKKHINQVKVGLSGNAYIRLDPKKPWPNDFKVNI